MNRLNIGRNAPCFCGSGKKYKRCCLYKEESLGTAYKNQRPTSGSPEPYINLVPSLVHGKYRFRTLWNQLHYRPPNETFHEFIIHILKLTLGKKWHDTQLALPFESRHVVMKWLRYMGELINRGGASHENNTMSVHQTGYVAALLQLAYDCFCLQQIRKLPRHLKQRLRDINNYQGARYEIAVAAIMARAGFDIEFLDKLEKSQKHCEFIAAHKDENIKVGVEAKSRHRKGIINQPGEPSTSNFKLGLVGLFNEAKTRKPAGMPFIMFFDVNLPIDKPAPDSVPSWVKESILLIDKDEKESVIVPYSAVIVSNFSAHYWGDSQVVGLKGEHIRHLCLNAEHPISDKVFMLIQQSLNNYTNIPAYL
jgi:hypothetical protein